jgi:hypothetical protein
MGAKITARKTKKIARSTATRTLMINQTRRNVIPVTGMKGATMATNDKKADNGNDAQEIEAPQMFSHIDDRVLKQINSAAGKVIGRGSALSVNHVGTARTVFDQHTRFLTCRNCGTVTQTAETPCEGCGAQYELTVYIGADKG